MDRPAAVAQVEAGAVAHHVLLRGGKIAAIGPTVSAANAEVIDCTGAIVMPGFITTHHHQYETLQRSLGVFAENCRRLRDGEPLLNRIF